MRDIDILIVGGGFGGAYTARALERLLRRRRLRVLLVAPENFLLYSPLLSEAAGGMIEPRHAVVPLRQFLRRTETVAGRVTALDPGARRAVVTDLLGQEHEVPFRFAVLAPGGEPATFPVPGLREQATGFMTLHDAIWLRNRVLRQLEAAEVATNDEMRAALLTFTFVGGGYAGVEALAELQSLATAAARSYRRIPSQEPRWVLIEAQDRILPGLDERLADYTLQHLRERGVEVHLETQMTSCEGGQVETSNEGVAPYRSETIVWTVGQEPAPLASEAGLPTDDQGRVRVTPFLNVAGHDDLYAVGDAAAVPDPTGGICPPTAQHAIRQARCCAANLAAVYGVGERRPFRYRSRGMAVPLGAYDGAAQVGKRTLTGPVAWWLARTYHLAMMPGVVHRLRLLGDWTLSLPFPRDTSQLGAAQDPQPVDERSAPSAPPRTRD